MKPGRAVKSFLRTRLGLILLIALAIGVVTLTYTYVGGVLLAVVAILVFGLALPIWVGFGRPRTLAIIGVVVLLVSAPLITIVETSGIVTPTGAAFSPTVTLANGTSGEVLQNAQVSPFIAQPGSVFSWSVSIYAQFLVAPRLNQPHWIDLFISTCPGATGNNSPNCNAGYPFYIVNNTLGSLSNTTPTQVQFAPQVLNGDNIWSWQMGLGYYNATGGLTWVFLVGDPTYNGIEGPITGDYWSTYGLLIGTIYEVVLFYLGLVFFIALLVYMIFKNRRQKRKYQEARANPPEPTGGAPAVGPPAPARPAPPALTPIAEAACPNCAAVVYPGEKVCWKCGTRLSSPPSSGDSPLPSSPKG